jgi:hypothetical protein
MTRVAPSSNWESGRYFPPAESARLETFLAQLNLDALCTHAKDIHNRHYCTVRTDVYTRGQESIVLELKFGDDEYWVVRIRLPPRPRPRPSFSRKGQAEMESEIATMNYIKQNTSIPLPTVYGFDLDQDNTVGAEYVFMEALPGHLTYNLTQIPDKSNGKFTLRLWT